MRIKHRHRTKLGSSALAKPVCKFSILDHSNIIPHQLDLDRAAVNAVVDALSHLGVTHIDMPIKSENVWRILKEHGLSR